MFRVQIPIPLTPDTPHSGHHASHPLHLSCSQPSQHYLNNLFNLEDRVAMVTGASGGVGRRVCRALARSGKGGVPNVAGGHLTY